MTTTTIDRFKRGEVTIKGAHTVVVESKLNNIGGKLPKKITIQKEGSRRKNQTVLLEKFYF